MYDNEQSLGRDSEQPRGLEPAQQIPRDTTGRGRERWQYWDAVATSATGFIFGVFPFTVVNALLSTANIPADNRAAFSISAGLIGAIAGGSLAYFSRRRS